MIYYYFSQILSGDAPIQLWSLRIRKEIIMEKKIDLINVEYLLNSVINVG